MFNPLITETCRSTTPPSAVCPETISPFPGKRACPYVDAPSRHLHRADEHRPARTVFHVHVAVWCGRKLFLRFGGLRRGAHGRRQSPALCESGNGGEGVVPSWPRKGRIGSPPHEVRRGAEGEDEVLDRWSAWRSNAANPSPPSRPLFVQSHGQLPLVIEDDGVAIGKQRGNLGAAGAADVQPAYSSSTVCWW